MKLSPEARALLRSAVRNHPRLPELIDSQNALGNMTQKQVLNLAGQLGLDIPAVTSVVSKLLPDGSGLTDDDDALHGYSAAHPAFRGHIEFELEIRLFGQTIKRRARVLYEHTPDWAYYDPIQARVMFGWEGTSMQFEVLGSRPKDGPRGRRKQPRETWEELRIPDALFPSELWEATLQAIDDKAREQNIERRTKFGARA